MLTPRGAVLIGSSLALVVLGFVRIDGVLVALGTAGLLLLAAAVILNRRNLTRLALSLRAPSRVYAGAMFDLRITLDNRRGLVDAFGIRVDLKLSGWVDLACHAPWTAAGASSTARIRTSIPARGAVTRHHFALASSTPLGLFHVRASGEAPHQILIFPRPLIPVELFTTGALHDASLLSGASPGHAPGEPRGIRPWQPGDPAKRIHWPASARSLNRRRGLRIRENDPPGFFPQHCSVIFHSFGTSGELIRGDRFERALSLTCGTLRRLRELGTPAGFIADFNDWQSLPSVSRASFANVLASLARAERRAGTEAHDLRAALDLVPRDHSLVLLSDMPPDSWTHALPPRPALVIDVRQHRYGARKLHTGAA